MASSVCALRTLRPVRCTVTVTAKQQSQPARAVPACTARREGLHRAALLGGGAAAAMTIGAGHVEATEGTRLMMDIAEGSAITGAASTAKEICAALIIGIILIQVPQSDAASELLAKGQFGSMKQSANFISITTWVLIAAFIGLSAIASAN